MKPRLSTFTTTSLRALEQHRGLSPRLLSLTLGAAGVLALMLLAEASDAQTPAPANGASTPAKAALTVSVVQPASTQVPAVLSANGNITAWQEALIGAEVNGLRLAELKADVGDRVRRGQVLATFQAETVRAELQQSQAALAEAEATAAEAIANADRARTLKDSGALSAQQIQQYLTAELTARARAASAKANAQAAQLRLNQTQVLAPDDGIICARPATVGMVAGAGVELFKMIRGGRLEWRAEVPAADLVRIKPGQKATLVTPSGRTVAGTVRKVAPTVDAATRSGLVYVDLQAAADSDARPGMFARGEFTFDTRQALTLPASAVLLRDGYAVVMRVGSNQRVSQVKVQVISRDADRVAVSGVPADARIVQRGAAFLSDGDTVRVVNDPAPSASAPAAAK
ncbi:efflux RND transporter periplasmic adaptor subunit [Ideonella margarita]|uniref:Efflux RND transporter periplasmic adaptor subunit n=1 Tax=Ideonella margarita TaxID=2984191 RepID=A0ABU9C341_9BURK